MQGNSNHLSICKVVVSFSFSHFQFCIVIFSEGGSFFSILFVFVFVYSPMSFSFPSSLFIILLHVLVETHVSSSFPALPTDSSGPWRPVGSQERTPTADVFREVNDAVPKGKEGAQAHRYSVVIMKTPLTILMKKTPALSKKSPFRRGRPQHGGNTSRAKSSSHSKHHSRRPHEMGIQA